MQAMDIDTVLAHEGEEAQSLANDSTWLEIVRRGLVRQSARKHLHGRADERADTLRQLLDMPMPLMGPVHSRLPKYQAYRRVKESEIRSFSAADVKDAMRGFSRIVTSAEDIRALYRSIAKRRVTARYSPLEGENGFGCGVVAVAISYKHRWPRLANGMTISEEDFQEVAMTALQYAGLFGETPALSLWFDQIYNLEQTEKSWKISCLLPYAIWPTVMAYRPREWRRTWICAEYLLSAKSGGHIIRRDANLINNPDRMNYSRLLNDWWLGGSMTNANSAFNDFAVALLTGTFATLDTHDPGDYLRLLSWARYYLGTCECSDEVSLAGEAKFMDNNVGRAARSVFLAESTNTGGMRENWFRGGQFEAVVRGVWLGMPSVITGKWGGALKVPEYDETKALLRLRASGNYIMVHTARQRSYAVGRTEHSHSKPTYYYGLELQQVRDGGREAKVRRCFVSICGKNDSIHETYDNVMWSACSYDPMNIVRKLASVRHLLEIQGRLAVTGTLLHVPPEVWTRLWTRVTGERAEFSYSAAVAINESDTIWVCRGSKGSPGVADSEAAGKAEVGRSNTKKRKQVYKNCCLS